jgi:DNA-binding transcriptional regulator YhcF (GntR family)
VNELPEPELILDGGAPVGQQIERQLRRLIRGGALLPGEALPTVRHVAVGLSVSPTLVERAYARLEEEGLLSREEGVVRVLERPQARPETLQRLCREFLTEARAGGFSLTEVLRAMHAEIEGGCHHD